MWLFCYLDTSQQSIVQYSVTTVSNNTIQRHVHIMCITKNIFFQTKSSIHYILIWSRYTKRRWHWPVYYWFRRSSSSDFVLGSVILFLLHWYTKVVFIYLSTDTVGAILMRATSRVSSSPRLFLSYFSSILVYLKVLTTPPVRITPTNCIIKTLQ